MIKHKNLFCKSIPPANCGRSVWSVWSDNPFDSMIRSIRRSVRSVWPFEVTLQSDPIRDSSSEPIRDPSNDPRSVERSDPRSVKRSDPRSVEQPIRDTLLRKNRDSSSGTCDARDSWTILDSISMLRLLSERADPRSVERSDPRSVEPMQKRPRGLKSENY